MGKLFIKGLSVLAVAVCLTACGKISTNGSSAYNANDGIAANQNTNAALSQPVPSNYVVSQFTWNVSGGGDIQFTVSPAGAGFYIRVTRYQFQAMNVVLTLTQSDSVQVYNMLRNVFFGYDGFVSDYQAGGFSGSYSTVATSYRSGANYSVQTPKLYSGDHAAVSALFQNVTSRILR